MVKLAKAKQDKEACEKSTGVRYTELLRLSYSKPIRFVAIDPMHNLFLGTAKYVLKTLWIDEEFENNAKVLSKAQLRTIQTRIDSVKPPSRLGRLPMKISSSFSGFTAEQWKSWTTVYWPKIKKCFTQVHMQMKIWSRCFVTVQKQHLLTERLKKIMGTINVVVCQNSIA